MNSMFAFSEGLLTHGSRDRRKGREVTLHETYSRPRALLTFAVSIHLPITLEGKHEDSHFTDEETAAQTNAVACPKSYGLDVENED